MADPLALAILEGQFTAGDTVVVDRRGDRLFVEYRYTRDVNESVLVDALVKITDAVSVTGEFEENLRNDQNLKTGVSLLFTSQCWSLDVKYLEEGDDQSISFMVRLLSLGAVGTGAFAWLLAGGLFYTVGVAFYVRKHVAYKEAKIK